MVDAIETRGIADGSLDSLLRGRTCSSSSSSVLAVQTPQSNLMTLNGLFASGCWFFELDDGSCKDLYLPSHKGMQGGEIECIVGMGKEKGCSSISGVLLFFEGNLVTVWLGLRQQHVIIVVKVK